MAIDVNREVQRLIRRHHHRGDIEQDHRQRLCQINTQRCRAGGSLVDARTRPLRLSIQHPCAKASGLCTRTQPWLKSRRARLHNCIAGVPCRYTLLSYGRMNFTEPSEFLDRGRWRTRNALWRSSARFSALAGSVGYAVLSKLRTISMSPRRS